RTSPVSASRMRPGVCVKVSQIERPRPSSSTAPSIWYDAVDIPKRNPASNWGSSDGSVMVLLGIRSRHLAQARQAGDGEQGDGASDGIERRVTRSEERRVGTGGRARGS